MPDLYSDAIMSMPDWSPGQPDLIYHSPSGELRVGEASSWRTARQVEVSEYPFVALAIIDRLQSEIRYGAPRGASLLQRDQLSVLRHSAWVGDRCGQLAEELGLSALMQFGCKFLGYRHDLHEGLPGIKDMHGPALRWYRSMSPDLDSVHRIGERLVAKLVPLPALLQPVAAELQRVGPMIVKYADRDAMAVERAVLFHDRPAWLEQRVEIVDTCVRMEYGSLFTPYKAIEMDWLVDHVDNSLKAPEYRWHNWYRVPVSDAELSALRTWYASVSTCSDSTT